MTHDNVSASGGFGGPWTVKKLNILGKYLDAYTTALKNQPFKLLYVDAFAGSGQINLRGEDKDVSMFYEGSAARAIKVTDKPFDKLIFVESDNQKCQKLEALKNDNPSRNIIIKNTEANDFLRNDLQENWQQWRGILFLDPFATEVEWATIEKIAGFETLDTWILFPTSAITRMLPREKRPDDISASLVNSLTRIFGDESWRELYFASPQPHLFVKEAAHERERGVEGIIELYKGKLKGQFGQRFMEKSKMFKNSKNSPLFEFIFCAGNPKGASIAKKIANHILNAGD